MKITTRSQRQLKWHNILFYLLFITVIISLGYLSHTYKFEADWTASNRNTLTETSQTLLNNLHKPLKFIAYIPDEPALHAEIKTLISKYQRFKTDTQIEFINPDLQPDKAKKAGVTYTGQVAVHVGDKHEMIQALDEQTILHTLHRLSRNKQQVITFLQGHTERDPFSSQSTGMSTLVDSLSQQGFVIQRHNLLSTQSIPANTDILVIAAPRSKVSVGEVTLLQNYLKQGGQLLWLHDPDSTQSLNPLAEQLGILLYTGTVVDANQELQQLLGIRNVAAIAVIDYGKSMLTKGIETQTLFPFSTMVEEDFDAKVKPDMDWQYDAFLSSMPSSWLETGDINASTLIFEVENNDQQGPIPLALSLKKSYAANTDQGDEVDNDRRKEQRIVVMGDSDFMLNAFIGYGSNLDLAKNIFNWLSQDDGAISIPTSIATDTRLELSDSVLISLSLFFLILLPLGLIIAGVFIWIQRRKA